MAAPETFTAEFLLEDYFAGLLSTYEADTGLPVVLSGDTDELQPSHIAVHCPGLQLGEPYAEGNWQTEVQVIVCTSIESELPAGVASVRALHISQCLALRNFLWTEDKYANLKIGSDIETDFIAWGETRKRQSGRHISTAHIFTIKHVTGQDGA